ncbi:hypothetical protein B0I35DRAFT_406884 [Stachybotrys elegans]|uniref:Uncharacterized protein n=1 Tax=Stachybotrys elegans TaxID=80388 RepID=A0A8K0WUA6_9HYPO|nr:hypothetical protein B0I35DRAFT_406884 [Stachybotrys elegans]
MAPSFVGGFMWAAPVMFLDPALAWTVFDFVDEEDQGPHKLLRRWDPRKFHHGRHAPTWSWASIKVVPAVNWTVRQTKEQEQPHEILILNECPDSKLHRTKS